MELENQCLVLFKNSLNTGCSYSNVHILQGQ